MPSSVDLHAPAELAAILPEYLQHGGRRLQHRMAWSLAGAALLLALGQGVGTAATITVTTNDPNIASDGQCSLIEAIVNANNDAATFPDCAAGSGADTIVLPANANMTLSAVFQYYLLGPVGLPLITSRITIEGNGATIARQGNAPAFGLIFVKGNASSAHPHPRRSDASARDSEWRIFTCRRYIECWHSTIENSIISGNGLRALPGFGVTNGGTLTIKNSTISGNATPGSYGRHSHVERITISGNGGGISEASAC